MLPNDAAATEKTITANRDLIRCPISWDIFRHPVLGSDGHLYELSSLHQFFMQKNAPLSPKTSLPMTHVTYVYSLKQSLDADEQLREHEDRREDYDKNEILENITTILEQHEAQEIKKLKNTNRNMITRLHQLSERNERLFDRVLKLNETIESDVVQQNNNHQLNTTSTGMAFFGALLAIVIYKNTIDSNRVLKGPLKDNMDVLLADMVITFAIVHLALKMIKWANNDYVHRFFNRNQPMLNEPAEPINAAENINRI